MNMNNYDILHELRPILRSVKRDAAQIAEILDGVEFSPQSPCGLYADELRYAAELCNTLQLRCRRAAELLEGSFSALNPQGKMEGVL